MKRLKLILTALMICSAVYVNAQEPQPQRMTSEQRAKMMTERLTRDLELNEQQQKQVYDLQIQMAQEYDHSESGEEKQRDQMTKKMEERRENEKAQMKNILTTEQFEKWEKSHSRGRGSRQRPSNDRGQ